MDKIFVAVNGSDRLIALDLQSIRLDKDKRALNLTIRSFHLTKHAIELINDMTSMKGRRFFDRLITVNSRCINCEKTHL